MSTAAQPGPISVEGNPPPYTGPTSSTGGSAALLSNTNPDAAPSLFYMGIGVRDLRYLQRIGAGANIAGGYPNQDCGWLFPGKGIAGVDAAPSAVSTTNVAAAATVTTGVAMTLAGASTGITVLSAALTILPTGLVVPTGAVVIDGNPTWTGAGQSGAFAFWNPTSGAVTRCLSVAASATATGGAFKVVSMDEYGNLVHETVTAVANSTVNSVKCHKFVISITPQFTDTTAGHTYSWGTSDTYGFPTFGGEWGQVAVYWNNALLTASAGFTAGVTTTGTATSGDIRGTYALQGDTSNGTKKLQMFQNVPFAAATAANYAAAVSALCGVAQFAS